MAKTLIKVQRGAKKKYVKLEEVCFSDFLSAGKVSVLYKAMEEQVTVFCKWSAGCLATVQEKFLIPEDTILKVTDDHSVEELPLAESSRNSGDCSDKTEYVTLGK